MLPTRPGFTRTGRTSFFASRMDQRFSFCAYVPDGYSPDAARAYPLAVLIHGSFREAGALCDQFVDFAEANQCFLLAPYFPCSIEDPEDVHNYKHVEYHDIRFDLIVLDMIAELAKLYRLDQHKVLMHGFSGGGQFAHRFFYLHPERLRAISIGAPGTVTLADPEQDWWVGVKGMDTKFGRPFNPAAMREVPVQLVAGEQDVNPQGVIVGPQSSFWMEGINATGDHRLDRLRALKLSLAQHQIDPRFDLVPGVGHAGDQIQVPVKQFFASCLNTPD